MNFLNNDFSGEYSIEQPADSTESEAEFLKIKLLETHSRLMRQLEYSKDLQEQLAQQRKKEQIITRENEELTKRLSTMSMKQERMIQERIKQLEQSLVDTEKKNDLLRSDLESMRVKAVELAEVNHTLEG